MATDTEAIEAVKRGEKDRYAELVMRYQRMVYGIAWSQLGDNDLCEEAAQETFVRAFRYLVALRHPERFGGWLARIARNVSTSLLRKHVRELTGRERWKLEAPQPPSTDMVASDDLPLSANLRDVIAGLPPTHRECLVLFYLEGKNIRETAEVLNISEAAVKTRLHRARTELRGRLEERLETSLAHLAPRRDLSAIVLPLLPAMPFAAGLGTAAGAAHFVAGAGKLASLGILLLAALVQGAMFAALLRWYANYEMENLAPGARKSFRTGVIKHGVTILVIGMVAIMIASQWASMQFGPSFVFKLIGVYCVWGMWRALRNLRVNNSPFVRGQAIAVATFGVVAFLIGFLNAPMWVFFAALLPLNVYLYQTNKSRPARHDYNLFIRQVSGMLLPVKDKSSSLSRCTALERKAFARFLGRRFLVNDFEIGDDSIRLWLPPVEPTALTYLALTGANSNITLHEDSSCDALLGMRDLRNLSSYFGNAETDKAALEHAVARAVERSFGEFRAGNAVAAEAIVSPEADDAVFVKPLAESRGYRIAGVLSIAAAAVMLILFAAIIGTFHPYTPITQPAAAKALLSWSAMTPPSPGFHFVMNASTQPPPAFFGSQDDSVYRKAVFAYLQSKTRGNPVENFLQYSEIASPLYHALRDHTLTPEQFAALGFTHEQVMASFAKMDKNDFGRIDKQGVMTTTGAAGSYTAPDLELMALRLASLKLLGCLDQIDTHALPAEIAAHQVTPNWRIPDAYAPIDTTKAAGLFDFGWCSLRNTRAALWILQLLDKLDAIDRAACVEGMLRFHKGNGKFQADFQTDPWIGIHGQEDDMFYALDSFHMLGAIDRIPDFGRWKFNPQGLTTESNGKKEYNAVTGQAVVSWAYQLRLQEIRGY